MGKDNSFKVKVTKVHPLDTPQEEAGEKKLEGACDSPSSDKENASQENQKKEPAKEEEGRRDSLCESHTSPCKKTECVRLRECGLKVCLGTNKLSVTFVLAEFGFVLAIAIAKCCHRGESWPCKCFNFWKKRE